VGRQTWRAGASSQCNTTTARLSGEKVSMLHRVLIERCGIFDDISGHPNTARQAIAYRRREAVHLPLQSIRQGRRTMSDVFNRECRAFIATHSGGDVALAERRSEDLCRSAEGTILLLMAFRLSRSAKKYERFPQAADQIHVLALAREVNAVGR